MWLLNTARADLKFFPTPESVPGGYAILSHAWDEREQTFQVLEALRAQCAADGTNPRDLVCDKIREFCVLAEHGGHEWGWADMCCIDKTSSTDLSEAITSMYRYYSLAAVCYVYLRDVPTASSDDLHAPESAFRKSRWHKRGWTLQELIAPLFVVFFSGTWEVLGAKADLADLLEEITRVPVAMLKLDDKPSDYCVAARMSWAADRQTTRPEDKAYCLMGIFGIFMPPLYGEGRNAFLRLQEEIMRQADDPSIFAWGDVHEDLNGTVTFQPSYSVTLLARSPSDFLHGHRIRRCAERPQSPTNPLQNLHFWKRPADLSKLPTFSITPYGIMAHVLVLSDASRTRLVVLLLGIELEVPGGKTRNLGLLLRGVESPDHTRQLYVPHLRSSRDRTAHLIELELGPRQIALHTKTTLEWRTIYIVRGSPTPTIDPHRLKMVSVSLRAPFHIPQSEVKRFRFLQFESGGMMSYSLHPENPTDLSWRRHVALKAQITQLCLGTLVTVVIYLGLCGKTSPDHLQHWARIVEYTEDGPEGGPEVEHDCAEHHVDERPRQTHPLTMVNELQKSFGIDAPRKSLELSFEPYGLSSTHCRRVGIRLNTTEENITSKDSDSRAMGRLRLVSIRSYVGMSAYTYSPLFSCPQSVPRLYHLSFLSSTFKDGTPIRAGPLSHAPRRRNAVGLSPSQARLSARATQLPQPLLRISHTPHPTRRHQVALGEAFVCERDQARRPSVQKTEHGRTDHARTLAPHRALPRQRAFGRRRRLGAGHRPVPSPSVRGCIPLTWTLTPNHDRAARALSETGPTKASDNARSVRAYDLDAEEVQTDGGGDQLAQGRAPPLHAAPRLADMGDGDAGVHRTKWEPEVRRFVARSRREDTAILGEMAGTRGGAAVCGRAHGVPPGRNGRQY